MLEEFDKKGERRLTAAFFAYFFIVLIISLGILVVMLWGLVEGVLWLSRH